MSCPNAGELLNIARQALLQEILPAVSSDHRYRILMIANAMAIAERECKLVSQADSFEETSLYELCGGDQPSLESARRKLATAIRDGAFDREQTQGHLLKALRGIARMRLEISNPKALHR